MATTQNLYTGNGSTTSYSFTFEYLKQSDVKVTLDTVATTAFTFTNATTLSFTSAPANGVAIRIFRDTAIDTLSSTFFPGSAIKAEDLNQNFTQSLYVTQESETAVGISDTTANTAKTTADSAVTTANSAVTTANAADTKSDTAVSTANTASTNASAAVTTANAASTTATDAETDAASAVTTANTASTNASAAVTTANTASTNASTAVTTANSAVTTADDAETKADSAVTTANDAETKADSAVTTANTASTNASAAVTTANTADTNASAAVVTANAASAAVSNAVLFTLIANVAAIPGSPSNNDYVEIGDSTGIDSFSPLSGLPSGFVGASGLTVRLRYDTSSTSWVFLNYFANDSEDRYFQKTSGNTNTTNIATNVTNIAARLPLTGGTLTGDLTIPDKIIHSGDTNTFIRFPAADTFSVDTAGAERLRVDSAGNVGIGTTSPSDTLHLNGATGYGLKVTDSSSHISVYRTHSDGAILKTASNHALLFGTNDTERMRIDSSGKIQVTGTRGGSLQPSDNDSLELYTSATNGSANTGSGLTFYNHDSSGFEMGGTIQVAKENGTANNTASYMRFATRTDGSSASERLRIDSSGNVGIGTTSPDVQLHVNEPSGAHGKIKLSNTEGSGIIGTNSNVLYFEADRYFLYDDTGNDTYLAIDSSGNVGIGTSSPKRLLHLNGGSESVKLQITNTSTGSGNDGDGFQIGIATDGTAAIEQRENANLTFATNNTERMRIDSSGNVGIGTSSPNAELHIGGSESHIDIGSGNRAKIGFKSNDIYIGTSSGSGQTIFKNNVASTDNPADSGTERMRIDSSGNLLAAGDVKAGERDPSATDTRGVRIAVDSQNGGVYTQAKGSANASSYMAFQALHGTTEKFKVMYDGTGTFAGAVNAPNTAKAWVNFNGTGTVSIRDSFNVSSITDNGTGLYRVNFSTSMANANYAVVTSGSRDLPESSRCFPANIDQIATGSFDISTHNDGSSSVDWELVTCVVFGD